MPVFLLVISFVWLLSTGKTLSEERLINVTEEKVAKRIYGKNDFDEEEFEKVSNGLEQKERELVKLQSRD